MSLRQIDLLIDKADYSSALAALSDYIKENPDGFDKAQRRIKFIMAKRAEFNAKAEELAKKMGIESQSETEENRLDEEKMNIINALEDFETNRPAEEVALTNDARRTVRLSYYINKSNLLMRQGGAKVSGASLLDVSPYVEASAQFSKGLTLKTADSDLIYEGETEIPVVYPESFVKKVAGQIEDLQKNSAELPESYVDCQVAYEAFVAAVQSGDLARIPTALADVKTSFRALAKIRNKIYEGGSSLEKYDAEALRQNPKLGMTSYVTFSLWAASGVPSNPDTGILGAVDAFWNTRVESMKEVVSLAIGQRFESLSSSLPVKDSFQIASPSALETAPSASVNLAKTGKEVQNLYSLLEASPASGFTRYAQSMDFAASLAENKYSPAAKTVGDVILQNGFLASADKTSLESMDEWEKSRFDAAKFYEQILTATDARQKDPQISDRLKNERSVPPSASTEKRTTAGIQLNDSYVSYEKEIARYNQVLSLTKDECQRQLAGLWSAVAKAYSTDSKVIQSARQSEYDYALSLLEGIPSDDDFDDGSSKYCYPEQALKNASDLSKQIEKDRKTLNDYLTKLSGGEVYAQTENSYYGQGRADIQNVLTSLSSLSLSINGRDDGIAARAQRNIRNAKNAEREAEDFLKQARRALSAKDFRTAEARLQSARDRYDESYALRYDRLRRLDSDSTLDSLAMTISREHKVYVDEQVPELIGEATDSFYNQQFDDADSSLTRAASLWAEVYGSSENSQISMLSARIKNALTASAEREIKKDNSRYKEMSQILRNANQFFDEGISAWKKSETADAKNSFNQSLALAQTVLGQFPYNAEASALILKVEEYLDPAKFRADCAAKASSSGKTKIQYYNDLCTLRSVNPKYPGLDKMILEVEYDLELKTRPVANLDKNISESAKLYKEALRIYNSAAGSSSQIARAQDQLNRAISLNPRNREATRLLYRIQSQRASATTPPVEMTSADNRLYKQALSLYQSGKNSGRMEDMNRANEIVTGLRNKYPANTSIQKLYNSVRANM